MKQKTIYVLSIILSLFVAFLLGGFLLLRAREQATSINQETIVQNDISSMTPSNDSIMSEDIPPEIPSEEPAPFQAVPAVPAPSCFTYEELADGTLRITEYDESKNTDNPYQVIIPSTIDGKSVSTLGSQSIKVHNLLELVLSDGITTLENEIFASPWDPYLVMLPDSVVHINEKAFYRHDASVLPVIISCNSEASHAYEYALENGFACQLVNPTTEENTILLDYATGNQTAKPYFSHFKVESEVYDFIVIEYLDITGTLQAYVNSNRYLNTSSVWMDNEFAVLVQDRESGAVQQCIDSRSFRDPEKISLYELNYVYCQSLLSIADWNFDGIPDICLNQGFSGVGADSSSAIFLFDKDSSLYTEAQYFPMENIVLLPDKQCIYSSGKIGPIEHFVNRYQYIDGVLTHVATITEYDFREDDSRGVGVRDERLINGEWQIYREEIILLDEDYSTEAYDHAYEQLTYLYVDDGYWDF